LLVFIQCERGWIVGRERTFYRDGQPCDIIPNVCCPTLKQLSGLLSVAPPSAAQPTHRRRKCAAVEVGGCTKEPVRRADRGQTGPARTRSEPPCPRLVLPGRQEVECHGENQIDHQRQHANEPRCSSTVGNQGYCRGGNQHHHNRTGPELQIH